MEDNTRKSIEAAFQNWSNEKTARITAFVVAYLELRKGEEMTREDMQRIVQMVESTC